MSGTIVPEAVTRQTIPYADRPIGQVRAGAVYPTLEFYQFLQRLTVGFSATTSNVGTVIAQVNTITVNLGTIETEIDTINAEISTIEAEIGTLGADAVAFPLPPFSPPLPAIPPSVPALLFPDSAPPTIASVTQLPVAPSAPTAVLGVTFAQAFGIAFFLGG